MLRAFSANWPGDGSLPHLDRDEIHHLVRVRRVRRHEELEILNGRGAIACCRVADASPGDFRLELVRVHTMAGPALRRHLMVALPKGKTFPVLLHRLVELGVHAITPLLSDHSEAVAERVESRADRWEAILIEAAKQSGNPWLPELGEPRRLDAVLSEPVAEVQRICGALQPDAVPLWNLLGEGLRPTGTVQVFIGPEGDFSLREYTLLRESGCLFASLGPLVLKVDTAASLMAGTLAIWSESARVG